MRAFFDWNQQLLARISTGLMAGDRPWALLRLIIVLFILLTVMSLGATIFEQPALNDKVAQLINENPELQNTPRRLIELRAIFLTGKSWRYIILPSAALIGALFLGARYIQDIYNLTGFRRVLHYFIATIFDVYYPSLIIEDGKPKLKPGEENMVEKIGGPGRVIVHPGSVALFENLHNPSNIRAEGSHFVSRFEKLKETGSLEEQHGHIEQLSSVTKDGVRVHARDIHYRYRILPNRHLTINEPPTNQASSPQEDPSSEYSRYRHALRGGRTPWVPYPYSIQAIRRMTYNRLVSEEGLVSWADTVRKLFESEIKDYIRRNNLDQITAPRAFDRSANGWELRRPRQEIHNKYQNPSFRKKMREIGAELLWYGIGYYEVTDHRVNDQRVETWQATWKADILNNQAGFEARRLRYEEEGRAIARTDILRGIVEGLDTGNLSTAQREDRLPELLLTQVANLLDSIRRTGNKGNQS